MEVNRNIKNNNANVYYGSSDKRLVNLLYAYNRYKLDTDVFYKKFDALTRSKNNNIPEWLKKIIKLFKNINMKTSDSIDVYTDSEFRHDITKTLYDLQKNNKYSNILRTDFSKYYKNK